jgi:carbonic anhydrase/acetyltransferase-like protein (isoleucine patch superfamily)
MAVYALGDRVPTIHPTAYVHPDAVVIGSVTLAAESNVWPGAVLRADFGVITVGERTSIQDGTIVHVEVATTIGADCVVGHNAHLHDCIVEDGCLIGSMSVVLHGAVVRAGGLVGSHALVPNGMEVPSRAMALGVPAKIKPDCVHPEVIAFGVKTYVENAARYRTELRRLDA